MPKRSIIETAVEAVNVEYPLSGDHVERGWDESARRAAAIAALELGKRLPECIVADENSVAVCEAYMLQVRALIDAEVNDAR